MPNHDSDQLIEDLLLHNTEPTNRQLLLCMRNGFKLVNAKADKAAELAGEAAAQGKKTNGRVTKLETGTSWPYWLTKIFHFIGFSGIVMILGGIYYLTIMVYKTQVVVERNTGKIEDIQKSTESSK